MFRELCWWWCLCPHHPEEKQECLQALLVLHFKRRSRHNRLKWVYTLWLVFFFNFPLSPMDSFFISWEPSISHQGWFKRFWKMTIYMDVSPLSHIFTCVWFFLMNQWRKTLWCHWDRAMGPSHLREHLWTLLPMVLSIFWTPLLIFDFALYNPIIIVNSNAAGQTSRICIASIRSKVGCPFCVACPWHFAVPCYRFSSKHLDLCASLEQCAD